jgi:urease accessory protein
MEVTSEESRGWQGSLALRFAARDGPTLVAERAHRGPLQVQRAFYPEGPDLCHVYLLHPPGGLVGGDSLDVRVEVERGARALVTTPAAGKIYRSAGAVGSLRQRLVVAAGGSLEWLPPGDDRLRRARASSSRRAWSSTRARASLDGRSFAWGDRQAGERFARGQCRQRVELWRAGEPLCLERARFDGAGAALDAPGGWPERRSPPRCSPRRLPTRSTIVRALASLLPDGDLASATRLGDVLVCRYLGASAERARAHLGRVWAALRPALLGRGDAPPRIWLT